MSEGPEWQLRQLKFWVGNLLGQAGVLQVKQEHSEESVFFLPWQQWENIAEM